MFNIKSICNTHIIINIGINLISVKIEHLFSIKIFLKFKV